MISKLFIFLIHGLRPILGDACCKHPISCGNFAVEQLKTQSLGKSLWIIFKRVMTCFKITSI